MGEPFTVKESTPINYQYATDEKLSKRHPMTDGVQYLQEAVEKMTGWELPHERKEDVSNGIILMLLAKAPDEIKNDQKIVDALKTTEEDDYNANEAFYIRTEPGRVLIVANTLDGLTHGMVRLLESVEYEVLGMGPNWIHVPDHHHTPLTFDIETSDRPGFYIRFLAATSGQDRGFNTMRPEWVNNPEDESVQESYKRWRIGTHMAGSSMSRIRSGHALGHYHRHVVREMRRRGTTQGFLADQKILLGDEKDRPAASAENKGVVWINKNGDEEITSKLSGVWRSDGKEWVVRERLLGHPIDLSVSFVREAIFEELKKQAELSFQENPSTYFDFQSDPEDGNLNYQHIGELAANPDWFPDYLEKEGKKFGEPYVLHNFKGLDQPIEVWSPESTSDTVYGFAKWLLLEYDKWIKSLPAEEQLTSTGKPKNTLLRVNLLSYNFHDVPPGFNLDSRIRVKIAGFPKNRGRGKWRAFKSSSDMAEAYRLLLSGQPSVDYQIWSQSYYHDYTMHSISGSPLAPKIHDDLKHAYDSGFRGLEAETDFNFGKFGLRYYLATKMLWNPFLSIEDLDNIRDRWMQRAFGPAWQEMKAYYDFMSPKNLRVSSPNTWGQATHLLDAASQKIQASLSQENEPYRKRIDDVKQYWYFYYLLDVGDAENKSERYKEFIWKGQMSYMTPMVMAMRRFFDDALKLVNILDENLLKQPAHYSAEETKKWWNEILTHWQPTDVQYFHDSTLANGIPASKIDLNDLVWIDFPSGVPESENIIRYNRMPGPLLKREEATFLTIAETAGDPIGFQFYWPLTEKNHPRDVPWGLDYWNAESQEWEQIVDITMTIESTAITDVNGEQMHLIKVTHEAGLPGTYRFFVGRGDWTSSLTDLNLQKSTGHVYYKPMLVSPRGPRPWYFYIPKNTTTLDLETSGEHSSVLRLYKQNEAGELTSSRVLNVKKWGVHSIKLLDEERGNLAVWESSSFPQLYSVPQLSSKNPQQLLIPRAIAEADGLLKTN